MKNQIDREKKKLQIINLKMTRIILFRYMVPVIFFINMYLCIFYYGNKNLLLILPLINMIGAISCIVEQYIYVRKKESNYILHKAFFVFSSIIHIIIVVIDLQYYLIFLILIEMFLLYKIILVSKNKDRFMKKYDSILKKLYKEI